MTATHAVFGSLGWTTIRAIAFAPIRPTRLKVAPESSERYTPSPHDELLRSLASPLPTQTTLASEGATAIAPMAATASFSKIAENEAPALVDFTMPPVPSPT